MRPSPRPKALEMSRNDTEIWQSGWELTGSPLYKGHLKSEPLWSYHPSIETIKKSPRKSSHEQSTDNSCFLSLETTVRGSLLHPNDRKEPFREADIDGNEHSLVHQLRVGPTTPLVLQSSKTLPVSPPRPSSGRQRNGRLQSMTLSFDTSSADDGSSSPVMEETKDCAADNNQLTVTTHEKPISRYEKLRSERLKLRSKIAQRRVGRQDLLPFDSNPFRRKAIESQNETSNTSSSTPPRASRAQSCSYKDSCSAAILIQACTRRFLASKVLAAKQAEALQSEPKRLQQQICCNYFQNRTARVNAILEKIKAREIYPRRFQVGYLYTIQEE